MAHQWNKGVLTQSSWHGLESIEAIPDAETMIRRGEEAGGWPVAIDLRRMRTVEGLDVPGKAVVASYKDGSQVAHGAVGDRYRPLDPKEWRATVEAAVAAGARPAGAFSLADGSRLLATFEIPGGNDGTGIRNYLNLVDSLDGSLVHLAGGSSIRVVCANTLRMAMGGRKGSDAEKNGFAAIRHTASINDRAAILRGAIEAHIKEGEKIRDLYKRATERRISRKEADVLLDVLFPMPSGADASKAAITRAENLRVEFARAAKRPENRENDASLATLWNAATWMVDRDGDQARSVKGGGNRLDSMVFGSRGKRVEEIRALVEVVMRDGTTKLMEAPEAHAHGIDHGQIGKAILGDLLS
jgi:hypothetical protein